MVVEQAELANQTPVTVDRRVPVETTEKDRVMFAWLNLRLRRFD
jgi:hypothetical protein